MKRKITTLFFILLLLLTACGGKNQTETANTVDPSSGEWTGAGECYVRLPGEACEKLIGAVLCEGALYTAEYVGFTDYELCRDAAPIYSSERSLCGISCEDAVIYVLERYYQDGFRYCINKIAPSGELLDSIDISGLFAPSGVFPSDFAVSGGVYYFSIGNRLLAADESLNVLLDLETENTCSLIKDAEGEVYLVQGSAVSTPELKELFTLSEPEPELFAGADGALFFLRTDEGIYAVAADGTLTPKLIWRECGIPACGSAAILALSGGEFICADSARLSRLKPAEPAITAARQELVLAAYCPTRALMQTVDDFNCGSESAYVTVLDYSEGLNYDMDTAETRLKTDVLSGKVPDMICFSYLSPFEYVKRGMLEDLNPYFAADDSINTDDIMLYNALGQSFYYISPVFCLETLEAQYSRFGDSLGWTMEEYLNAEATLPAEATAICNMDRASYISCIELRYIGEAVDYDSGVCDFERVNFIALLDAGCRIKEYGEGESGYGAVLVAQGNTLAALTWVDSVWKLAYDEKLAGARLSFIGWPTTDGSCGTDARLTDPVAIVSGGESTEACFGFIKYLLMNGAGNGGIPMYRPEFERAIAQAKNDSSLPVSLTDSDVERFEALIAETQNIALYDENIADIIKRESEACFMGVRSPQEAAARIQSAVSIYLAEQYG